MNWLSILQLILKVTPAVTQLIQLEHDQAVSGADKKTMATTAILGATGVAGTVLTNPKDQMAAAIIGNVTAHAVDSAVAAGKADGTWAKINGAIQASIAAAAGTTIGIGQTAAINKS